MQLLVSVADADEAADALVGGAHVIDAKDPRSGPLGAVAPAVFVAIRRRIGTARPVSAALGDAADEDTVERDARRGAEAGAAFVKVGFAGTAGETQVTRLLAAARRGAAAAPGCGVVAVAYADADRVSAPTPGALVAIAAGAGASGVLLDTADKAGPGLLALLAPDALAHWVSTARRAGLLVALAGRLTSRDVPLVRQFDIDLVGVRGAACAGGRHGRVVSAKVRALVDLVGRHDGHGERRRARALEERIHRIAP